MKKLLFTLLTIAMFSCTSNIDKKIVLDHYQNIIESLKTENPEYSEKDFQTASVEFNKHTFLAMSSGLNVLDITYKDLLNNAKQINLKKQKEYDDYSKSLEILKQAVNLEILKGQFIDISLYSPVNPNGYTIDIKLDNNSKKTVKVVKGTVLLFNTLEQHLLTYVFEQNLILKSNDNIEGEDLTIIFEDDNLTELKALPFNRIKQEWYPKTIIFEDGSRLDALPKPLDY